MAERTAIGFGAVKVQVSQQQPEETRRSSVKRLPASSPSFFFTHSDIDFLL